MAQGERNSSIFGLKRLSLSRQIKGLAKASPFPGSFLDYGDCSQITVNITAMLHPEDSHLLGPIVQVKEYPILAAVHPISVFLSF